jgi:methionine synthase I (cobalamin-dependent)
VVLDQPLLRTSMLERLLAERDWLLADGAIGSNLFAMGLAIGDPPERWLTLHPERIVALHRSFVAAGADIILTNTFGCNRRRLARHHLATETYALNQIGAELAHAAVAGAGRPVVVAGSVGPTGNALAPFGALTEADAIEIFIEQMQGLKAGGAQVIWIETMSALGEMRAAATAAGRVGLRYVLTASFHAAASTVLSNSPEHLVRDVATFTQPPLAIGVNCGVGASDLVASILEITAADPAAIVVAKANCGIPKVRSGRLIYDASHTLMQDYARLARDAGARIIGGCCGTTPEHLAAMNHALNVHPRGQRPSLERVVAVLGPLLLPPREHLGIEHAAASSTGHVVRPP